MSIQGLKESLYKQIEALDNAEALQLLHDAAVDYNSHTDSIISLTEEQKARLEKSIQQANEGKTISHTEAMELIAGWRRK